MEKCVKYHMDRDSLCALVGTGDTLNVLARADLWEVWEGLPTEHSFFSDQDGLGRPTLKAEGKGYYIWVFCSAVEALQKNPKVPLIARVSRVGAEGICARSVDILEDIRTLDELTHHAHQLNLQIIEDAQKQPRPKQLPPKKH